jgi:phosphate transport system permease protein
VAIALGIAISPTIFSLAEDAIEAVPEGLKRASFALGATRLQTLKNVVLKTAFPGIVAALMLGLGRAFGETMIVLMVTGNTPVADWDLLASLRAMTANLAIELPESEVDSAHYRVLFLTAFLLFLFTFVVNTIAEILRVRSRKVGAI